jgi:hypothetical protein
VKHRTYVIDQPGLDQAQGKRRFDWPGRYLPVASSQEVKVHDLRSVLFHPAAVIVFSFDRTGRATADWRVPNALAVSARGDGNRAVMRFILELLPAQ